MQIRDMYKLVYQATLGSEHAISSPESAAQRLERELAEMGGGLDEPVIDPISSDGQIVRVHLRPFVAQGGEAPALLEAFIRTAKEYHGDAQTLKHNWKTVAGIGYYSALEINEFTQFILAQGYPAVHHSAEYQRLYRPAYRVVWQKFIL